MVIKSLRMLPHDASSCVLLPVKNPGTEDIFIRQRKKETERGRERETERKKEREKERKMTKKEKREKERKKGKL